MQALSSCGYAVGISGCEKGESCGIVLLRLVGVRFGVHGVQHGVQRHDSFAPTTQASRSKVMTLTDPHEIHSTLMKLHVLENITVDELAQQSVSLFKSAPPQQLIKKYRLRIYSAVVHRANLENCAGNSSTWMVPEPPAAKPGVLNRGWGRVKGSMYRMCIMCSLSLCMLLIQQQHETFTHCSPHRQAAG